MLWLTPFATIEPSESAAIDWAATLAFRHYVVGLALSRAIFRAPTLHYKTGVVFLPG